MRISSARSIHASVDDATLSARASLARLLTCRNRYLSGLDGDHVSGSGSGAGPDDEEDTYGEEDTYPVHARQPTNGKDSTSDIYFGPASSTVSSDLSSTPAAANNFVTNVPNQNTRFSTRTTRYPNRINVNLFNKKRADSAAASVYSNKVTLYICVITFIVTALVRDGWSHL